MKKSKYNSLIPLSSKIDLLYNALSDTFLFVHKMDDKVWSNSKKLEIEHPSLFKKLCENGFYVEDCFDEFETLQRLNQAVVNNDRNYFIIINPTLACNYKCWYCYENHIPHSKMSEETLDRVYKHMVNVIKTHTKLQSFCISFFGGEPLLHFKDIILPIIHFYNRLCEENDISFTGIGFTSNGGLLNSEIVETLAQYKNVQFQITLDGGKNEHNRIRHSHKGEDTYTLILRNVMLLLKNNMEVRLRINYTSDCLNSLTQIADDLNVLSYEEKTRLNVDFHQVWQERILSKDLDGVRDVVNYFDRKKFKMTFNDVNMLRNPCYGDKRNTAVINYNGDIYKCTANDFTKVNREGYLDEKGNIVWLKSQDYRTNIRFKNGQCRSCRIAPLCGGGCSRHLIARDAGQEEDCIFSSCEKRINELILDRLDMFIRNRHKNG